MLNSFGHAVIIGAGIGGLSAAAALAHYFDIVTVMERDDLSHSPRSRFGAPQSLHLHGMLAGGMKALEALLPGFHEALGKAGAVPIVVNRDFREEMSKTVIVPRRDLGMVVYAASRILIEGVLRSFVKRLPNVDLRPCCCVTAILTTPDGGHVTGVRFQTRAASETLDADFVVDASGRGALTLDLIRLLGRTLPPEEIVGVNIRYASATFRLSEEATPDWLVGITHSSPPDIIRGGFMMSIERGLWMMIISGRHGDWPPGEPSALLQFMRQMRTTTLADIFEKAELVGSIRRFAVPATIWRHYESAPDLPEGLVPIADAICQFNPLYGQGMSVAAIEGAILGEVCRSCRMSGAPIKEIALRFLAEVEPVVRDTWTMTTSFDFALPQTTGERPTDLQATLAYMTRLGSLAGQDKEIHKLLLEVRHLLKPAKLLRETWLARRVNEALPGTSKAERKDHATWGDKNTDALGYDR